MASRCHLPIALLLLCACTGEQPPEDEGGGGSGGTGVTSCPIGDRLIDGACVPPGVPAARCAEGFESDGAGCVPILPPAACGPGTMALPGETQCRPVSPCGAGPHGEIPVEANTQFVDASFAGTSNGSQAAPWTTIQQGVDAAQGGAIVAVAPGLYVEDVAIDGKPVRLWGKCPGEVELRGTGGFGATLFISGFGAKATEVHGLAVTGPAWGIAITGAEQVLLEGLWIHDTDRGLELESFLGATSVTLSSSLIENATDQGILVAGITFTMIDSVVRDTQPSTGISGYGMTAQNDTQTGALATVGVQHSIFERNHSLGMLIFGATTTLDGVVVRDTLPSPSGYEGRGIGAEYDYINGVRPPVGITSSVVANNPEFGIFAAGADVTVEATTIRDTLPEQASQRFGRCINSQDDHENLQPANLLVRDSLIERCHDVGLAHAGGLIAVEGLLVRDTFSVAEDGTRGRGINIQKSVNSEPVSDGTVVASRIERATEMGLLGIGSTVTADNLAVIDTLARADGAFGDGINLMSADGLPTVGVLSRVSVARSARAGIAAFSASVSLSDSLLSCNTIQLDGETLNEAWSFDDVGGNRCLCDDVEDECKVLTQNLTPPEAVEAGM